MKWFNIFILSILVSMPIFAQSKMPYFCNDSLESLPVLANGRVKPLYVHSNEMIKYISGKKKQLGYSATQIFCLLSLKSMGMEIDLPLTAHLEHMKVREFLNTKESHTESDVNLSQFVGDINIQHHAWILMIYVDQEALFIKPGTIKVSPDFSLKFSIKNVMYCHFIIIQNLFKL